MPESPDFERIARVALTDPTVPYDADRVGPVADALRSIWNARGAADIAKVESELSTDDGRDRGRAPTAGTSSARCADWSDKPREPMESDDPTLAAFLEQAKRKAR
jgi:hypothetical protein